MTARAVLMAALAAPVAVAAPVPKGPLAAWGTKVDPDDDCTFTVAGDTLTIGLPAGDHSLDAERGKLNGPRVVRPVAGDFLTRVTAAGDAPAGAASVVPTRIPFFAAGLLVWADEKNYLRLERARVYRGGMPVGYVNYELRKGGDVIHLPANVRLDPAKPLALRLERRGGRFQAAVSEDGEQWTDLPAADVVFPKTVEVGVAALHTTDQKFAPTFRGLKIDPAAAGK